VRSIIFKTIFLITRAIYRPTHYLSTIVISKITDLNCWLDSNLKVHFKRLSQFGNRRMWEVTIVLPIRFIVSAWPNCYIRMPYQEILANWSTQLAVIPEDTVVSINSVIYTRTAATSIISFGSTLDPRQFDVWNYVTTN